MAKSEGEGNEKKRKIKAKEEYRNKGVRAPREGRQYVCVCVRVHGCMGVIEEELQESVA